MLNQRLGFNQSRLAFDGLDNSRPLPVAIIRIFQQTLVLLLNLFNNPFQSLRVLQCLKNESLSIIQPHCQFSRGVSNFFFAIMVRFFGSPIELEQLAWFLLEKTKIRFLLEFFYKLNFNHQPHFILALFGNAWRRITEETVFTALYLFEQLVNACPLSSSVLADLQELELLFWIANMNGFEVFNYQVLTNPPFHPDPSNFLKEVNFCPHLTLAM